MRKTRRLARPASQALAAQTRQSQADAGEPVVMIDLDPNDVSGALTPRCQFTEVQARQ